MTWVLQYLEETTSLVGPPDDAQRPRTDRDRLHIVGASEQLHDFLTLGTNLCAHPLGTVVRRNEEMVAAQDLPGEEG